MRTEENRFLTSENDIVRFGREDARFRLLVIVAIHGNEPCGVTAANRLISEGFFSDMRDHVTILLGNPRGYDEDKRSINFNLNRGFSNEFLCDFEYERERVAIIKAEMARCDAFLDIHSTSADTRPWSSPARGDKANYLAASLPVAYTLRGLCELRSLARTTVGYASTIHKPGALVECGSHSSDGARETAENLFRALLGEPGNRGKDRLLALVLRNWYPREPLLLRARPEHSPDVLYTVGVEKVGKGFQFCGKCGQSFHRVEYGETVALDDDKEIVCPYRGGAYIAMPTAMPVANEEAFMWAVDHSAYVALSFSGPGDGMRRMPSARKMERVQWRDGMRRSPSRLTLTSSALPRQNSGL